MYVTAIVLAAGKGLRFSHPNSFTVRGGIPPHESKMIESGGSRIPKPLVKINAKPIIVFCLKVFNRNPDIRDIILVVNAQNKKEIIRKISPYRLVKIKKIVLGGKLRQDSVINGLKVMDSRTDLVLIHDSVRPFIDKQMISSLIKEAKRSGAAVLGVPVRATIKEVHSVQQSIVHSCFTVKRTLNRSSLWEIQTPQVFKKDLIFKAYQKFGNLEVTDDATLVEKLGVKVSAVLGSYNNIKITTPDDLVLAEAIAKNGI